MAWGLRLEEIIVEAAGEAPHALITATHVEPRWSTERPWQRATPDGLLTFLDEDDKLIGDDWLVEAKATRAAPPDEPRLDWLVQAQHQLMVWPMRGVVIAAMGALEFRAWRVEPHPSLQRALLAAELRFLALIESETPPPVRAEDNRWLAQAYPLADTMRTVRLGAEALEWDRARQTAAEHLARWQEVKDLAEARIKAAMGPARTAVLPDGTSFSWSPQKRKEYSVPAGMLRVLRRKGAKNGRDD